MLEVMSWWRRNRIRVGAAVVPVALIASLAVGLHITQQNSRSGVQQRFIARGALASEFVSTWISQLLAREQSVGASTVAGPSPTQGFDAEVAAFGFAAAVLLDDQGRGRSPRRTRT
jgi:hypothetical protein